MIDYRQAIYCYVWGLQNFSVPPIPEVGLPSYQFQKKSQRPHENNFEFRSHQLILCNVLIKMVISDGCEFKSPKDEHQLS